MTEHLTSRQQRVDYLPPVTPILQRTRTAVAFFLLVSLHAVLKMIGYKVFRSWVSRFPITNRRRSDLDTSQSVERAVAGASRLCLRRRWCLERSAVAACLLRLEGVRADVVIGVRRVPFYSHAWVEVGDTILFDDAQYIKKNYQELDRF